MKAPRLAELDPDRVADDAARALAWRIRRLVDGFVAPAGGISWLDPANPRVLEESYFRSWVHTLAVFAKTGQGAATFAILGDVAELFYGSVAHRFPGRAPTREVLSTEIGVVLGAAEARLKLQRGAPVTVETLAALAGASVAEIRRLLKPEGHGHLRGTGKGAGFAITATSAQHWLVSLGVPGFPNPAATP